MDTGLRGGLTVSSVSWDGSFPVCSAISRAIHCPQTRPWHIPIPARVIRFAQISESQPICNGINDLFLRDLLATANQRIVIGPGRVLRSEDRKPD